LPKLHKNAISIPTSTSTSIDENTRGKIGNTRKKKSVLQTLKRQKYLYLLFIPGAIHFIIFRYIPMFGIIIAFQDYDIFDGFLHSKWVGFKHFISFFTGPSFWQVIINTLLLNVYLIIWGFPVPIILSLLLNEVKHNKYKRFVQTVSYLPHFISAVVIVGIVSDFLSPSTGPIAHFLDIITGKENVIYMAEPNWFRSIYVVTDIWRSMGWGTIIYLAALSNVDPELYDAGLVDGANRFQRIIHITIPSIVPTIIVVLILRMGSILNVSFETVYLMQNPLNVKTSEVISTFVYKRGIERANYSFGAAVGLFNSLIGLILVTTVNKISNKITESSLW